MTTNNTSEWDLMIQGKYSDAYGLLSHHISSYPERKYRYLYNRGLCLLNLNQPEKALLDFSELLADKPESASGYLGAAVSSWWLKKPDDSIMYWRRALDAKYTDSAGGIEPCSFLLFAAIKLKDSELEKKAVALLQKKLHKKKQKGMA